MDRARLFSVVPTDWKRDDGQTMKHRKPSEHEGTPSHSEDD